LTSTICLGSAQFPDAGRYGEGLFQVDAAGASPDARAPEISISAVKSIDSEIWCGAGQRVQRLCLGRFTAMDSLPKEDLRTIPGVCYRRLLPVPAPITRRG